MIQTVAGPGDRRALFVVGRTSVRDVTVAEVGAKAFGLMMMSEAGLPTPPAFVLGTGSCRQFLEQGRLDEALVADVFAGTEEIERLTGQRFGARRRPLLVSVRSGAPVSMPGMLETVLNVGLCDATVPGLLRATGNPVFVWDSYRRLIQAYAEVVEGCPAAPFTRVLEGVMTRHGALTVDELDVASLRELVEEELGLFRSMVGGSFPQDPHAQLLGAVAAVFRSWNAPRAVAYREMQGLSDLSGTAVTVQSMVFGNTGVASGSGVGFTRDPALGENCAYVDFILNAQGEDVVSGRRVADDSDRSIAAVPDLAHELQRVRRKLESTFGDAQDFEFTVQEGKLWMLQTRPAKRTAWAALRIACDLVDEGIIDVDTAIDRLRSYDLRAICRMRLADESGADLFVRGTPGSDGVASGRLALDGAAAREFSADGDPAILVRGEASTEEIGGLGACRGLVTATGARTSHVVVVARQLGLACVVACKDLIVESDDHTIRVGESEVREGEWITVDGATGIVYRGQLEIREERPSELVRRVEGWNRCRRL